jgi:hypothetical protein
MLRPRNDREAERMQHSALRQRIMDGLWKSDARKRMVDTVGIDRAQAWGDQRIIDIGTPLLRQAAVRNATLYLRQPYFEHPDDGIEDRWPSRVVNEMLRRARWGSLMTGVLQQSLALNDAALRYEVVLKEDGTPLVRFYPRSVAGLMGAPRYDDPSQPRKIYEKVTYQSTEVWRVWDETDRWLELEDGSEINGTRAPHGQGRCPWVLWHTTPANRLWSPYVNAELVDLTLSLAVAETFKNHNLFEASWPQRYIVNAQPAGVGVDDMVAEQGRQNVTADPATVLLLEQTGEGQPMVGQWAVGSDPKTMADAVDRQQRRASLAIGASGSDVFRASGETRSAYALEITRQNQRTQQVNLAPLCQPSDEWLAGAIALAVNTQLDRAALPIEGYRVRYRILSPSMEEVELVTKLMDAGLLDTESARLMLDPFADPLGVGETEAPEPPTAGPLEDVNAAEVSELALNGAQVTAAQGIVEATASGSLPRATAVAMLEAFFVMPRETAEAILGTVGAGFTTAPPPPTGTSE